MILLRPAPCLSGLFEVPADINHLTMPERSEALLCPCLAMASLIAPRIVRPPIRLPASKPGQFSVGSLNLLTPRFDEVDYYPYVPHDFRLWTFRKPMILERLRSMDVDILCCQEAAGDDPALLEELASTGYEPVAPAEPRRGIEKPVTFVRQNKFSVVAVEHRSRASLLALREVSPACEEAVPLTLFVANVHLQGDPSARAARRSQLESVCRRFRKLRSDLGVDTMRSCAVVVGDFNEPANTELHRELQAIDAESFPARHSSWKWVDCYGALQAPPPTFRAEGRSDRIDFIYHSANLQAEALRWPLSYEEEDLLSWAWNRWPPWPGQLPCEWYPSDHLPLAASLVVRL